MKKLLPLGDLENRIFIQNGFFYYKSKIAPASPLHRHHNAEIHIVREGEIRYWIENEEYVLKDGDVMVIPDRKYHSIIWFKEGTVRTVFQVDIKVPSVIKRQVRPDILNAFFDEILLSETKDNYLELVSYMSIICASVIDSINSRLSVKFSDSLLVSYFFEQRYNGDVHVSDLSELLHISDRQTQLLVKRITGRSFRQELTYHRMTIARYLEKHTDMSLAEIAFKVGFKSYSGFWKVYKTFKDNLTK